MAMLCRASLFFLLVLPCCLPGRAAAQPPISADEAQLLIQIKRAWGDPPALSAWNGAGAASASVHCTWPYVTCDRAGRVTNLSLANTNVTGVVPDAIGRLSSLTHLDISNNNIHGNFPAFLYNCTALRYLNISQNYLGGELPSDIGRGLGENLTTLALNGNYFLGTIPSSLSSLRNLEWLALDNNLLAGTVPAVLGDLTSLRTLTLANNAFDAGELPASFKNLTKLATLWAAQCNLVGDFPAYVAEMPELEMLDLSVNALIGSIPPGLWNLTKLQTLTIWANNLTGDVVVDGRFGAVNLVTIDLSSNHRLSGSIPEGFGHLPKLVNLNLFFNNFSGEIPASIGRLPSLVMLKLFSNHLTGPLPPDLGKSSPGLLYVEVDDNAITGTILEGLCDNGKFQSLTASGNRLSGSIPERLANCTTLSVLLLHNNQLSSEVPEALWTETQLMFVYLRNNNLTGRLPSTMLPSLIVLHIENNRFTGHVPAMATDLREFFAGNNDFSGEIPVNLAAGMPLLQVLNLSSNHLSGRIFGSVAELQGMTLLDLSRNQLTGMIPADLGSMTTLTELDLSSNRLSGDIPQTLTRLVLNSFNLSSNQLSGDVPGELAVAAYDQSFLDNPNLCTTAPGFSQLSGLRTCAPSRAYPGSGGISPALSAGLLTAGATLVVVVVFIFFLVREIKKREGLVQPEDWKVTPFHDLAFPESTVLQGLTEENIIGLGGSGRVYRIAYTNRYNGSTGAAVAVKQIGSGRTLEKKLEREFESEVDILGNIRHNNIVTLLCCISGAHSKLLVYEYMDNGSLEMWLHGHCLHGKPSMPMIQSSRRALLDWPTRLTIAVGAAQGLCYMHHDCSPPIVHRDVKSSNILLDSDFRAKVADFGLARFLVQAWIPDSGSAVAGSLGYMAPECAYTRNVNEKADVYSFGVVLLELTTGRKAYDGGDRGSLAELAWWHLQSGRAIADVTDKYIRDTGCFDEIEAVFKLGVLCTGTSPSSRPTMKDVQQILFKYYGRRMQQRPTMGNSLEYY